LFNSTINTSPLTILPQFVDEPVFLLSIDDEISCFPNICTHRGFKLVSHPGLNKQLSCAYHGRRFNLDGKVEFMPEFKEVENFPRPCDHLQKIPLKEWNGHLFASFDPAISFSGISKVLNNYIGFYDFRALKHSPDYNEEYTVNAHWALYIDNYMEGFHIPFVHRDLNKYIDYGNYTTDLHNHVAVQIGFADKGSPTFKLPESHMHYGKSITAYYIWIWPNIMLNCYPWGIQYNIVKPITANITKVSFIYYICNKEIFDLMQASKLADKTEREDEFVVEEVHQGVKSRFYSTGRYSAKRETGVHYFQSLIAKYMSNQ